MSYRVELSSGAAKEFRNAHRYLKEHAPDHAPRWLASMRRAVLSLSEMPQRCALAPESEQFELELRQLIEDSYRILFTIAGRTVRVLHIRHSARKPLRGSGDE